MVSPSIKKLGFRDQGLGRRSLTQSVSTASLLLCAAFCTWVYAAGEIYAMPQTTTDNLKNQAVDNTKPVQVYIMLGQSNMLGFGRVGPRATVGSLEYLVKEKGLYPRLVDAEGNWVTRQDVRYVHVMDQRGVDYKDLEKFQTVRNEWLSPKDSFGPELGFGQVLGDFHDQPVLLLKACIGNRSLGWDLLPPGSERFEHEGKIYAGYKDVANFWDKGAEPKPVPWYAGRQYDADTNHAKIVLSKLADYYPGYQGQGYEIAGFVWWQGHKDQSAALAGRYEQNLVHLIKTLRKDFDAPNAKFVLATGCGNPGREGFGLQIAEAQLAVDGDREKYPEFKGNVKAVDVRDFWRDASVSPVNQGHHYNHNAETYYEVGNALGLAIREILETDVAKVAPTTPEATQNLDAWIDRATLAIDGLTTEIHIPFTLTAANNISIKVVLNDKEPLQLMFHTAVDSISLTKDAVENLTTLQVDNSVDVESWGGKGVAGVSTGNRLRIENLDWNDQTIFVDEFSGPETDGKFGPNLFADQIIEINFDNRELVIYPKLPEFVLAASSNYRRLECSQEHGSLFITGELTVGENKITNQFMLHTGFGGTVLLDDTFVKTHKLGERLATISERELTDAFGNKLKTTKVRLGSLDFGGIQFVDIPIELFEGALGKQKISLVGTGLLQRFNMVIDPANKHLYVVPNGIFGVPFAD